MTNLCGLKRHHEPHFVRATTYQFGFQCTGKPRWPHTRPKPPRINTFDHEDYQSEHDTIAIYKASDTELWYVEWRMNSAELLTHTEAIFYAQKLAQERSKTSGLVQGR